MLSTIKLYNENKNKVDTIKIKKSVDEGLEPPQQEPESRVLPLHQSTIK